MRKRILILTKSNKRRHDNSYGKCVAGVSLEPTDNYQWIRLVADSDGDSLSDSQFPYNKLDIIEADLYPCPLNNQIENCCFDNHKRIGKMDIDGLRNVFSKMPHSFFGNMRDCVANPSNSLTIFFAKNLHFHWVQSDEGKKQKMNFDMGNNHALNISMTDREFYTNKEKNETKNIPMAICVASLPCEPNRMNQYAKIIAAIFPVDSKQYSYDENHNIASRKNDILNYDFSKFDDATRKMDDFTNIKNNYKGI